MHYPIPIVDPEKGRKINKPTKHDLVFFRRGNKFFPDPPRGNRKFPGSTSSGANTYKC